MDVLFILFYVSLFVGHRQIKQLQGVCYHILFYLEVQGCVCAEAGRVIDLNKPRFELLIDQDVKPQNLKAVGNAFVDGVLSFLWRVHVMLDTRLSGAQSPNDDLLYTSNHLRLLLGPKLFPNPVHY